MGVEIFSLGGYDEVGRNMTAIKVDEEVIICDLGIHLENYIILTQDEDVINIPPNILIEHNAVPNIKLINKWKDLVKAIIPTHAHLDHIGGIPMMAQFFDAPIICTPFSGAVLKAIIADAGIRFNNTIKTLNPNSSIKLTENITIEFVSMTHSTPQTVMVVIHSKYGKIVYANDFKFDNYPVLGTKPNMKRLHEIGKHGDVLCLIADSLYSRDHRKMPSETVAREMLKDVLLGTHAQGKAIIVTTFSSHIARLKSIVDFSQQLKRKVLFLGRSLNKYVAAAEEVGIAKFSDKVDIIKYSSKIKNRLNKVIRDGKDKFVLVVTGHQGEPGSALSKMANGLFHFDHGDHVIFSSTVIPTLVNQKNRAVLEETLEKKGVRIFRDIHVSGHAAREDHRDLLEILKPKHIIPTHGDLSITSGLYDLAIDLKYDASRVHIMKNGSYLRIE
jgi:ribonuclease J